MATMPSASLVANTPSNVTTTSNMASVEAAETPLAMALQIVEKKVRNLEKRKGKLDGYRANQDSGKTLNSDQKSAIAKYDEVMQNLEFARELTTQFRTLAFDEDRNRKKAVKREQQERIRSEVTRLATILGLQTVIRAFATKSKVRSDFTTGESGAVKLTKEQVSAIEEFGKMIEAPTLINGGDIKEADKVYATVAGHLASLVDGKSKEVCNTTYKDLLTTLQAARATGYFNCTEVLTGSEEPSGVVAKKEAKESNKKRANKVNGVKAESERVASKATETPQGAKVEAKPEPTEVKPAEVEPAEAAPQTQVEQPQPKVPQPVVPMPTGGPSGTVFPPPPNVNVNQFAPVTTASAPSINFLQESQIDMESPHMDPAVVMVHHATPPVTTTMLPNTVANFSNVNPIFITPTTIQAAMQHHHQQQQQQHFGGHFQQVHQPPQQPPVKTVPAGAPGFNIHEHQPQMQPPNPPQVDVEPEPSLIQDIKVEPNVERREDKVAAPAPSKPPGYATIAAVKPSSDATSEPAMTTSVVNDAMASINDWSEEVAANDEANGVDYHKDRRDGFRGRGGRGNGHRGGFNYRGGSRGGRGRGAENGDRGGYRGRGNGSRGGFRENRSNNRGNSGHENRGRGNRGSYRGTSSNGYRENGSV